MSDTTKRVQELDKAATPGPWRGEKYDNATKIGWFSGHTTHHGNYIDADDAALIAEYRTLAPELAREVERLTDELAVAHSELSLLRGQEP